MNSKFEIMLSGGHPNSLGRTEDVVDLILKDQSRLEELYQCYFSEDDVVRLRVSSAFKRITQAQPDWTMAYMDRLQSEIAAIDQASTQWTLAILFDLTKDLLSKPQKKRALEIMYGNLVNHQDWIVLNTSMQVLFDWAKDDPDLLLKIKPEILRLKSDTRKSVSGRANKLLKALE